MSAAFRPTRAEIDLAAVRSNCRTIRALLRPGVRHLAVVKADAYGHGDVEVARACLDAGADALGVAIVEEGVRLRDAGITAPILLLGDPPSDAAGAIVRRRLTASISTSAAAEALDDAARGAGERALVHVVVDSGMHREGAPPDDAVDLACAVDAMGSLELEGFWTHLACADEPGHPSIVRQLEVYDAALEALAAKGVHPRLRHAANSAATLTRPDAHFDMVRTGIVLYGLPPAPALADAVHLQPAMRLVTQVAAVKHVAGGEGISYGHTYELAGFANIAVLPVGYADGWPRLLSNAGDVLIGGVRRRIAGRVTMDQVMVDCGTDAVKTGDEAVLIGRQDGEEITATEVAERIGTIAYEIVSSVTARVPRMHRP